MRARLWPDSDPEELAGELANLRETVFVADSGGRLVGFIEAAIRSYAEGASGPAGYVEGVWVEPDWRGQGAARALLRAVERWAGEQGLDWLGSDAVLDNDLSHAWHRAAGFEEIEWLVVFGKPIG